MRTVDKSVHRRRRAAMRTAALIGLLALAVYIGFILMSVLK